MSDGEDWLMRPVLGGLCKFEGLTDGTLSLEDLLVMNQALDVKHENELRWQEHQKNKG